MWCLGILQRICCTVCFFLLFSPHISNGFILLHDFQFYSENDRLSDNHYSGISYL